MANRWRLAIAVSSGLGLGAAAAAGCGNRTPPPAAPETVPTTVEYQKPPTTAPSAPAAPANDYPPSKRDDVVE